VLDCVSAPEFHTRLAYFLSKEQITVHLGEAAQVILLAIISVYLSLQNLVIIMFIKTNDFFFRQIN